MITLDDYAIHTDLKSDGLTVAIKMIRNNDTMRKAAEKELSILTQITKTDPDGRKHCIHILEHSEFRNHVVFVFESMNMNLRKTLEKFGKNVGINVSAVRLYARQLFVALKHIGDQRVVHADIKLDNILVSEDLKQVGSSPLCVSTASGYAVWSHLTRQSVIHTCTPPPASPLALSPPLSIRLLTRTPLNR